ncbi:MAG TPA: NAD-dependent epimerase/dehydratase family protein [Gaiellaceae bacterium]|nr:NAD-dependent epimerase/dehydratase family protein [Gaiellaceae bacterium]
MRVVVTGASGNVGTSVLRALARDDEVDEIVGVARRRPRLDVGKTEWQTADVEHDDLVPLFSGADCVVHLAWRIQPSHDLVALRHTNVDGSERVFRAAAEARVPSLVHGSSVGAYSPHDLRPGAGASSRSPKRGRVDETWPTEGTPTSFYARHKAEVERLLDRFERELPETRVVRLRPGLIFKRGSAEEQRRYFLGPLFPRLLARPQALALVPAIRGLRLQAVHTLDVAEAYRLAVLGDARGPFNIAAEPVLDPPTLAAALGARTVPVPARVARGALDAAWRLRLQPTPAGWLDMGLAVPIMSTRRAREELGWHPKRSSLRAIRDVLAGIADADGEPTPPLEPGPRAETPRQRALH